MARDPYPAMGQKYEDELTAIITLLWQSLGRTKTLPQLEELIKAKGVAGLMSLLDDIQPAMAAVITPVLESAIIESGRSVISILPVAAIQAPLAFSLLLPSVSTYVRAYTGDRITQIATETKSAVREAVTRGVISGRNPKQVARDFRSSIGLTVSQTQTVQRFREALKAGDKDYINSLSTPTKTVRDKVNNGAKLSDAQIDKMVEEQSARYVKIRTETIARTESLTAVSVGQHQAVNSGQIAGSLSSELLKKWLYAKDDRTRAAHISTGQDNGWIPVAAPFVTPLGPLQFPRDPAGVAANVINCRCRVKYSLPEDVD